MSVREIDYSYEIDQDSLLYRPNGIRLLAENLLDEYVKVRETLEEVKFADLLLLYISLIKDF
jgi:hypothetical protein